MEQTITYEVFKELIRVLNEECIVNLDIADIYSLMQGKEKLKIGFGQGEKGETVEKIFQQILSDKEMLEMLHCAKGALFVFSGDCSLVWASEAMNYIINGFIHEDAELLLTLRYEEGQKIKVTVFAME